MSPRTITLSDGVYAYLLEHSLREPPVLARLRVATAALGGRASMQIAPEQGQFMALLVELTGARRVLEIGTFTGYSALACALAMPPDGILVTCDVARDTTEMARRYWTDAGVGDRIESRIGPALETLDQLLDEEDGEGRFDLAFIDADKTSGDAYYERCLRLVRPGGLILIDNVLWGGSVADPEDADADTVALRALNAKLHADERISLSMLPVGDGLTLARRR